MVIRLITMVVLALAVSTGAWGQTADPQVDELRERVANQRAQLADFRRQGQLDAWRQAVEVVLYGAWDALLGLTEIMVGYATQLEDVERRLEVIEETALSLMDGLIEVKQTQLELLDGLLAADDWSMEVERRLLEIERSRDQIRLGDLEQEVDWLSTDLDLAVEELLRLAVIVVRYAAVLEAGEETPETLMLLFERWAEVQTLDLLDDEIVERILESID